LRREAGRGIKRADSPPLVAVSAAVVCDRRERRRHLKGKHLSSYQFDTKDTGYECHVCMTSPSGHTRRKRFRNGYASARLSARSWIATQIQDIETESSTSGRPCPDVFVDGLQVVSSNPPTISDLIDVLKRITQQVKERGPDSGELFEASCDAEELVQQYERSLRGKFLPKADNV